VLRLRRVLGLSLNELKELSAEEFARAARKKEWDAGVDDPVRRREILEEAARYAELQLELLRRRRAELDELEQELVAKRRRVRGRLRDAARPVARR
jgi:DNA-binding transcriptional MerR regulator